MRVHFFVQTLRTTTTSPTRETPFVQMLLHILCLSWRFWGELRVRICLLYWLEWVIVNKRIIKQRNADHHTIWTTFSKLVDKQSSGTHVRYYTCQCSCHIFANMYYNDGVAFNQLFKICKILEIRVFVGMIKFS